LISLFTSLVKSMGAFLFPQAVAFEGDSVRVMNDPIENGVDDGRLRPWMPYPSVCGWTLS
jgi:hypothetical protein